VKKAILTLAAAGLLSSAAAQAADEPEAVYQKLHAAELSRNMDEMLKYATEARRKEMGAVPSAERDPGLHLMVAMIPKNYRVAGKAASADGNAVQLHASGTGELTGLGNTQMYGVIDFVKENGEWKVEKWGWSTDRPGELPPGFVMVQGQAPEPRATVEPKEPRVKLPEMKPEPSRLKPKPAEPQPDERVLSAERSVKQEPCEIKPVMSDDELRACGARIPR
jgi:hypothetical protein